MDVTSEASVREGVGRIVASDGNIDILVNCAGMGVSGPAEETGWDMLSLQFDTNVFGSLAVTRAVLPIMRESGAGRVVFTGSVAGRIPIPFQSAYSASKAAISSFARAIRSEVKPFGITVSVVEPGDVKTNFTNQRAKKKLDADSPYSSAADAAVSHMERDELAGMAPEAIADAILNLLSKRRPPARLVPGAQYKLLAFLQRLLPDATVERIVEKIYLGRR
jgi:short-subunit dehydrogenase